MRKLNSVGVQIVIIDDTISIVSSAAPSTPPDPYRALIRGKNIINPPPEEPPGPAGPGCGDLVSWDAEGNLYFAPHPLDVHPSWGVFSYGGFTTAMTPDGSVLLAGIATGAAIDTAGLVAGANFDGSVEVFDWDHETQTYIAISRFSHTDASNSGEVRWDGFGGIIKTGASPFGVQPLHTRLIAVNEDGAFVTVGAPDYIGNVFNPELETNGAVYLFERDGNQYNQIARITTEDTYPSNGGAGFEGPPSWPLDDLGFGSSIALRGDGGNGSVLFISQPEKKYSIEPYTNISGHIYAFTNISGTWVNTSRLTVPIPAGDESFGEGYGLAISRDGSTLVSVIGFYYNGTTTTDIPAYRVYRWDNIEEKMMPYAFFQDEEILGPGLTARFDVCVSDNGQRIVTLDSMNGTVCVWDDQGNGVFSKTTLYYEDVLYDLKSCSICGTGEVVAISHDQNDGTVIVFKELENEWVEMARFQDLPGPRPGASYSYLDDPDVSYGWSMAMSQDGRRLFTTSPVWADQISDNTQTWTGAATVIIGMHDL
jgi:WD40 repeat protein